MGFGIISNYKQGGKANTTLIHVWGQSNASDIVAISGNLPAQYQAEMSLAWGTGDGNVTKYFHAGYDVFYQETTGTKYGVSTSLAYKMSNTYGKRTIISNAGVLNTSLCTPAFGSGNNGSWNINDAQSLYNRARDTFALPAINRIAGDVQQIVVWIQGENDAGDLTAANAYYQNMVDLINKSRSPVGSGGLGVSDLPWIIVELRSTLFQNYQIVRTAEQNLALNLHNVYYFDTSFVNLQVDNIHYTPQSFIDCGNNLADVVNPLLRF